jgi:hypothetical protein
MKRGARYTAKTEAYQESGVRGKLRRKSLGTMSYRKKVGGRRLKVRLRLFPLVVKKQIKRFPERKQRTIRWFSLKGAVKRSGNPSLARLLRKVKKAAGSSS